MRIIYRFLRSDLFSMSSEENISKSRSSSNSGITMPLTLQKLRIAFPISTILISKLGTNGLIFWEFL